MMKPRYDTTQLKSHPKRNRKQNELVKTMLKHLDLMLGENHAGELLAIFVDLLKRAVNETPDGKLELRSIEIILNDYFHAKNLTDDAQFKIDEDHKKLRAFEMIKEMNVNVALLKVSKSVGSYHYKMDERRTPVKPLTQDAFDFLKEMLK